MSNKGKGATKPEDMTADAKESKRLLDLAIEGGVLSNTRRIGSTTLPPTKLITKADGKDIVKKSSNRKNRYLLVFNCKLAPAAAGRLGTLAQLDSKTPVMYIDFPQGRLKLFGSLVFPKNKYMVLKMGVKEVLCEDVLESMLVFSEAWWVGTKEENPEEKKLPMPAVLQETRHTNYTFVGRSGEGNKGTQAQDDEDDDDDDDGDEPHFNPSQRPGRRAARGAGGGKKKRPRYAEDSDADFDSDDDDDSDAPPSTRKLPKLSQGPSQQPASSGKKKPRVQQQKKTQETETIELLDESDDDDQPLKMRKTTKPKPKAAKKKPVAVLDDSDDEVEEIDLLDDDSDNDDEGPGSGGPSSQRPRRAAKPQKNLKEADDSDEDMSDAEQASDYEEDDATEPSEDEDDGSDFE